jgi:hypothetical protein
MESLWKTEFARDLIRENNHALSYVNHIFVRSTTKWINVVKPTEAFWELSVKKIQNYNAQVRSIADKSMRDTSTKITIQMFKEEIEAILSSVKINDFYFRDISNNRALCKTDFDLFDHELESTPKSINIPNDFEPLVAYDIDSMVFLYKKYCAQFTKIGLKAPELAIDNNFDKTTPYSIAWLVMPARKYIEHNGISMNLS